MDDFHTQLIPSHYCSNCNVHKGFFDAEQSIISQTIYGVRQLIKDFPGYSIIVTGHSLGAALATLTTLDLMRNFTDSSPPTILMINFGSPSVGDDGFASYASEQLIPFHYRVTHYRDIVPHLPWSRRYTHINGEWYEDEDHLLHECQGYEDSNCADQWYILSIEDHMSCAAVSSPSSHLSIPPFSYPFPFQDF